MMTIVKEGNGPYGYCYIETDGVIFYVHIGSSTYGPYSSLSYAVNEFNKYCY